MNDYERIASTIRFLGANHSEQPNLATLARHAGLSPFHFHRLFTSWAGITPKDFLQCLTVAHAKALLRKGESVLGAALEAGLSGPGRLHDLCVQLEAASPGELKSGGKDWVIQAGMAESPFGTCFIADGPRGICRVAFVDSGHDTTAVAAVRAEWPRARVVRDDAHAALLAADIFRRPAEKNHGVILRAYVRGTPYQVKVWRALLEVQPGCLVTYGGLAARLGNPNAARAVGAAVGRNQLAYLIPCHRVILETGVAGNYRWGHERKRAMLAWESAPSPQPI